MRSERERERERVEAGYVFGRKRRKFTVQKVRRVNRGNWIDFRYIYICGGIKLLSATVGGKLISVCLVETEMSMNSR